MSAARNPGARFVDQGHQLPEQFARQAEREAIQAAFIAAAAIVFVVVLALVAK